MIFQSNSTDNDRPQNAESTLAHHLHIEEPCLQKKSENRVTIEEKMGAFIFFIYNFHSDPIFNILPSFRMYWAKYPYLKKWIVKITLFCSWMRFLLGEWLMTMLFLFSYSVFSHCSFQFRDESICHCFYFTIICSLSNLRGKNQDPFICMRGK